MKTKEYKQWKLTPRGWTCFERDEVKKIYQDAACLHVDFTHDGCDTWHKIINNRTESDYNELSFFNKTEEEA